MHLGGMYILVGMEMPPKLLHKGTPLNGIFFKNIHPGHAAKDIKESVVHVLDIDVNWPCPHRLPFADVDVRAVTSKFSCR